MSNFAFLKAEWPDLHEAAGQAEALAFQDARAACFNEAILERYYQTRCIRRIGEGPEKEPCLCWKQCAAGCARW